MKICILISLISMAFMILILTKETLLPNKGDHENAVHICMFSCVFFLIVAMLILIAGLPNSLLID